MPYRPPAYSQEEFQLPVGQQPIAVFPAKSGVVVTQVSVVSMNPNAKPLQEFQPLSKQTSRDSQRPNTSQGVVKTPRRMSFSRPLTSEGTKPGPPPIVPPIRPRQIDTHRAVSDPRKIGVAVGSPTQWITDSPLKPRPDLARRLPRSNTDQSSLPRLYSQDEQAAQPKVQRWKSVGGLFKKKKAIGNASVAVAPEQKATPKRFQQETIAEEPSEVEKSWPARKSSRFRSRSIAKSGESKSCVKLARKPVPPPKAKPPPMHGPWSDFQEQVRRRGSKPQLDVTIPKSEFERYSVMFSELLKNQSPAAEPARTTESNVRHEAVLSVDTVRSDSSIQPDVPVSNRDRPINHVVNAKGLQLPPKIDTGGRSPAVGSNASGTPKITGYSLFPTVKPSPEVSANSPQSQVLTPLPNATTGSPAIAPVAPNPTPQNQLSKPLPLPRNHIISQHISPTGSPNPGLGLNTGVGIQPMDRAEHTTLFHIEPRELRSPDFSPDSPVTARSSISSAWSSRPSITHSHKRSKSSGHIIGGPGPSISSYFDSYYTPPEGEQPPLPVQPPPPMTLTRQASLRSHPMHPPADSLHAGQDGLANPQVAVARQVSLTGPAHKPQMLARTSSKRNREESGTLARLSENPSRAASPKMVTADNSDRPDERTWLQRRSVWGVIEEGGRVA